MHVLHINFLTIYRITLAVTLHNITLTLSQIFLSSLTLAHCSDIRDSVLSEDIRDSTSSEISSRVVAMSLKYTIQIQVSTLIIVDFQRFSVRMLGQKILNLNVTIKAAVFVILRSMHLAVTK